MDLIKDPAVRVFVATGFPQKAEAQRVMQAFRARGATITWDWTNPPSDMDRKHQAMADAAGVMTADVVLAIMTLPDYEYKGTWTEIGMAIGARQSILLITPFVDAGPAKCSKNIYFAHPALVRVARSVDEFLTLLAA